MPRSERYIGDNLVESKGSVRGRENSVKAVKRARGIENMKLAQDKEIVRKAEVRLYHELDQNKALIFFLQVNENN